MNIKHFPYSLPDWALLEAALRACFNSTSHHTNKSWFKAVDIEHVLTQVKTGAVASAIVDNTYLLIYGVGSPWYSTLTLVEEKMVLRLRPGGSILSVTALLDIIAAHHDASYIAVGTALVNNDQALVRMYQRADPTFRPECIQLIKEFHGKPK